MVAAEKAVTYEICEERIYASLSGSGEVAFNIFLSINNTGSETIEIFNFSLDLTDIADLTLTNLSVPVYDYWLESRRYDTVLHIETSILPGEIANLSLNFTTKQGILNVGEYSQFLFNTKLDADVEKFSFEIWLPKGCFLYTENVNPIYPKPTSNFTDGERLVFRWEDENLPAGTAKIFVVYYSGNQPSSNVLIAPFPVYLSSSTSWVILTLTAAAGITAVIAVALVYLKRRRERKGVTDTVFLLLSDSEKEILKLLSASKDKMMTQKEIQDATGYSKAKVSVTVSMLERKGLVEKKAKGRTRIVKLKRRIEI